MEIHNDKVWSDCKHVKTGLHGINCRITFTSGFPFHPVYRRVEETSVFCDFEQNEENISPKLLQNKQG